MAAHPIILTLDRADYRIDGKRRAASNFDRAAICRRAHEIKTAQRQKLAERVYAAEAQVVAGKPFHARSFEQVLKSTPVDFGAAMRQAWAEAKQPSRKARRSRKSSASNALAVIGEQWRSRDLGGLLASVTAIAVALGRTIKAAGAAIDARFLASRPASLSLPVNAPRQIQ